MRQQLAGGEAIEQVQRIRHHAEQAADRHGVGPGVVTTDPHLTGVGAQQPRDHAQGGRLARAVRADQPAEAAHRDVEVQRVRPRRGHRTACAAHGPRSPANPEPSRSRRSVWPRGAHAPTPDTPLATRPGGRVARAEVAVAVYPGSFDPLTIAHLAIADDRGRSPRARAGRPGDLAGHTRQGPPRCGHAGGRGSSAIRRVADDDRGSVSSWWTNSSSWTSPRATTWWSWAPTSGPRSTTPPGTTAMRPAGTGRSPRLPRVAVAPRGGLDVPRRISLPVPDHLAEVTATAVRTGTSGLGGPASTADRAQRPAGTAA